jgi:hypothetical protein
MQGLFGRFGKQQQSVVSPPDLFATSEPPTTDIEFDEFPVTSRFEDDEETNWDDVETLVDRDSPQERLRQRVAYPQPIVPVVPPAAPEPDEDWDEALPAATVKNSNTQEARRSRLDRSSPSSSDLWQERDPTSIGISDRANPRNSTLSPTATAIGFWTAIIQLFRRILPPPIRRLSDALLTAILAIGLTVAIWFVDGWLAAPAQTPVVMTPSVPSVAQPRPTAQPIDPEQAFIDAIQAQLNDLTSQYPDGIIQTLQVDLPRDLAIVRLDPVWYTIDDRQQDRLSDRMWLQARANHVSKLELQDPTGQTLARSPVVGQHMVVLQRRQS